MNAYIADQSWTDEAERLRRLEHALDSHMIRYLDGIGVTAGMSCLEIGAGQGSIARWFSERVGPTGCVVRFSHRVHRSDASGCGMRR